jgi:outer membrane protein
MGRSLSGKRFLVIWAILAVGTAMSIAGPTLGTSKNFLPPANHSKLTAPVHSQQISSLQSNSQSFITSSQSQNPSQGQSPTTTSGNGSSQMPAQTSTQTPTRPSQPVQVGGPPSQRTTTTGASETRGLTGQSVPGAAKTVPARATLSLSDAIDLAIQNNLATLLAQERKREAQGFEKESRAGLLPNISGVAYQANLTVNLAALGFQPGRFPGFTSTFIGPFNNFDARVRLQQMIFSLSAIRNYQAGRSGVRVAEIEEDLAREQVATFTALGYLEVLQADRFQLAAQADVDLAQALLKLAQDERDAGVATGVDVTRAETRLAQQQVRLAQAQTALEEAQLQLQRVVGLPLDSIVTLTDPLTFTIESLPAVDLAVAQAEKDRPEVRIAEAQVTLNDYERRAARADLLPNVEFLGDYGVSGITPTNTDLPTRRVAVQLNVPIFNGGLTQGRIAVAASRERQSELELSSTRGQVEEDVRLAFSALRTTAEAVRAADKSVELAQRELEMARDRFRAGVADNLEVISAQTALADTRAAQVTTLTQYNAARLNLAAALGRAQLFRW